jgi:hypothetical protein
MVDGIKLIRIDQTPNVSKKHILFKKIWDLPGPKVIPLSDIHCNLKTE